MGASDQDFHQVACCEDDSVKIEGMFLRKVVSDDVDDVIQRFFAVIFEAVSRLLVQVFVVALKKADD